MSREKIIGKRKIAGNLVKCPICGYDEFWTRSTLMNTPGLTFFGLDWANKSVTNFVCTSCGHVLWFLNQN